MDIRRIALRSLRISWEYLIKISAVVRRRPHSFYVVACPWRMRKPYLKSVYINIDSFPFGQFYN